jgi:hypothetical protein
MHTPFEHLGRHCQPACSQSLSQVGEVFSGVGKVENPDCIPAMDLHTCLEPIGSIHHCTHLFGLDQMASASVDFCHIGNVGCICQTRERREISDVDFLRISAARWDLPNRSCATFCPFALNQWDHGPIRADRHATLVLLRVGFFFPGLLRVGGLLFLNPTTDLFTDPQDLLKKTLAMP